MKYREALRQSRPSSTADGAAGHTKGGYIQLQTVDSFKGQGPERAAAQPLPPVWVDVSEGLKEDMQRVRAKMGELSRAHARALLPSFDTAADGAGGGRPHDDTIEALTHDITVSLKRGERALMRLTQDRGDEDEEVAAICRNVQRSMATDLQGLSMDFRKMQKGYLKRLQEQQEVPTTSKLTAAAMPPEEEDDLFDPGFDERQMVRARRMEKVSAEREQEISEIVQSVHDLAQIMKDLSVLVIDQGSIVDRIDYNIQNVGASVEKGKKALVKAESTQKKTAMLFCIMILIVLCLIMFVILVIKKLIF